MHIYSHTHRGPLDENHSGVSEDDGQVADLSVRLVLVPRPGVALRALHPALDQRLFVQFGYNLCQPFCRTLGDIA